MWVVRCSLIEVSGLPGSIYGTAARLPIGTGGFSRNCLPTNNRSKFDSRPLNPGYWESTAAIPPTETAIPRQFHPQDFPQRHRLQASELLVAKKAFTGAVTTAALLKTFAALFDELGGVLGRSVATWGGHDAGYSGCGWSW